jgi:transcriptional regulator with XRE-family HTH domain
MQRMGITTATELAERLQVHQSTVARWLEGSTAPRAGQLRVIADFLGVPEETVLVMAHRGRNMTATEAAIRRDAEISDEARGRLLAMYQEARAERQGQSRPSAASGGGRR